MNEEKIDKVGSKLGVDSTELKPKKWNSFLKFLLYPLSQILIAVLSPIFGNLFGKLEENSDNFYCVGYPYGGIPSEFYGQGLLTISALSVVSGFIPIPTKNKRINSILKIFISIGVFAFGFWIYRQIFQIVNLPNPPTCQSIDYGVFSKRNSKDKLRLFFRN